MTTNQEGQTFKNDNISVTVERKPNCQVKFDIAVQQHAMKAAYAAAIKNINKEVSIPGFRKGKAPEKWVLEKYKSAIDQESVDIALNTALHEALILTQLNPIKDSFKRPNFKNFKPNEEALFSIEFETKPDVPSVNPKDIKLNKVAAEEITDEMIDEQLKFMQQQMATYNPVNNRTTEAGDFAEIDIDMLKPQEKVVARNERVKLDDKELPAWVVQGLINRNPGETFEVSNPDIADSLFRITLHNILHAELPAIDEEFAKKTKADSMEDLKNKIREQLKVHADEKAHSQQIHDLEERLIEQYPFELPRSYVENDTKARVEHYIENIRREGANDEWIKNNLPQITKELEAISAKAIKLLFLSHRIADEHQLAVSEEEYRQEEQDQVMRSIRGKGSIDWSASDVEKRRQVMDKAFSRKIRQYLLDHANFG